MNTTMEELKVKAFGLEEITSSELDVRGGGTLDVLQKILEIASAIWAFLQNYWPLIKKGYKDGRASNS
ncbi:MAG: hypothetical protein GX664_00540 [Bacteroidales bacterium]|nr:hypothetical protein [Bacteroidales bacterium]